MENTTRRSYDFEKIATARALWIKAAFTSLALVSLFAAASTMRNVEGKEDLSNPGVTGGNVHSAILTTTDASRNIVVYSDPVGSPGTQSLVQGLPANALPHGLAYAGNDQALVGDFNNSRIFVVRPSDATLVDTIPTGTVDYNGSGTIAVPPNQNVALAIGSSSLKVIQAPFTAASTITSVTLPGSVQVFQTQAIVFNSEGRAFVRHSTGISVLDAPYTSVAFTIPINTGLRAAIAITPDGNTLLATGSNGITNIVFIFNAPFSAASTPQNLGVVSSSNGIKVTPDGTKAIVVSNDLHVASAISAPFSSSSNVQSLPLPAGTAGFEHVDISPDSQAALLSGRSNDEPPVLIRAPFTNAGSQSSNIPVNADNPNRGGGAMVFLPPSPAGTPTPTPTPTATPTETPSPSPTATPVGSPTPTPCGHVETNHLIASDGIPSDNFGWSVAISGDTALIGNVPHIQSSPGVGSAYVFTKNGEVWTEQQKLTVPGAGLFAVSLAIDGDTAVIGANGVGSFTGAAYMFTRVGGIWTQAQELTASDAASGHNFGGAVAIRGDTVVVGSAGRNLGRGAAYVFTRNGGVWTEQQILTASDGELGDNFGGRVAVEGTTVVATAYNADIVGADNAGAAYVFTQSGGVWTEQQKLSASDGAEDDDFGFSVALQGDTMMVGAELDDLGAVTNAGSTYVFTRSGSIWTEHQKLTASVGVPNATFGISVSISGDTAVIGAQLDHTPAGNNTGSAYTYTRSGGVWTQQQKLAASNATSGALFGRSAAIEGETVLVGAHQDNMVRGSAYVFSTGSSAQRGNGCVAPGETDYDFDGDGRADLSVFRPMPDPADNHWYILRSSDGQSYRDEWGLETDKLATADYDGDGKADLAVWRDEPLAPDRANFYILQSSDNSIRIEQFGRTGDNHSLVGDWDGDGKADPAVYREGTGSGQSVFYYRPSSQPGVDFVAINWGTTGDRPVRGDFDGDGSLDAAVFRPSDGIWYILQSSNGQPLYVNWGLPGDRLVPADYDGDSKTDVAVFRGGTWYILQSQTGQPRYETFGIATDILVPADYDGDGRTDIAIYRVGIWYIDQSTSGFTAFAFGLAADKPIPDLNN